jgi:hypothetical protein
LPVEEKNLPAAWRKRRECGANDSGERLGFDRGRSLIFRCSWEGTDFCAKCVFDPALGSLTPHDGDGSVMDSPVEIGKERTADGQGRAALPEVEADILNDVSGEVVVSRNDEGDRLQGNAMFPNNVEQRVLVATLKLGNEGINGYSVEECRRLYRAVAGIVIA